MRSTTAGSVMTETTRSHPALVGDGVGNLCNNCPAAPNPNREDGDACTRQFPKRETCLDSGDDRLLDLCDIARACESQRQWARSIQDP
jgi:hypothetical protein